MSICTVCVCVPTYKTCASRACLRLGLTFPTGAGVNKSVSHSRCGEQGRSASLQRHAGRSEMFRSQYLPSLSKPALFFYQQPDWTEHSLSLCRWRRCWNVKDASWSPYNYVSHTTKLFCQLMRNPLCPNIPKQDTYQACQ